VSKKVNKSAVIRNRIRRRMYEAVRTVAPRIQGAYDIVFIVYSDQLAEMPIASVRQAVTEKLEKAGVFGPYEGPERAGRGIVEPKENKI
jgi:ribonuclease P protein component